MSKEVNAIIEKLCEKLGVAADVLIPELARYSIAQDVFCLVILLALLCVSVIVFRYTFAYDRKVWSKEIRGGVHEVSYWTVIPALMFIVVFIPTVLIGADLVGWIASPTASAIMEISHMF